MKIKTQRKLGAWLIAISGLAMAGIMMVGFATGHSRVVASGSEGGVSWTVAEGGDISWLYLLPIILCGAIGVVCAAWPQRKPPKLDK